ncbi:MAG: holo-ACP synthase [Verrucomicrobiia bacterium]
MIGVGIDIIEVQRIAASYERFGERFLKRILKEKEIEYCLSHKNPVPHLAARFAAKEAVSKAFGTGIGSKLGWQDIEVCKYDSGQPFIKLYGCGLELMNVLNAAAIHLSLSHTQNYAVAVAVLEK